MDTLVVIYTKSAPFQTCSLSIQTHLISRISCHKDWMYFINSKRNTEIKRYTYCSPWKSRLIAKLVLYIVFGHDIDMECEEFSPF